MWRLSLALHHLKTYHLWAKLRVSLQKRVHPETPLLSKRYYLCLEVSALSRRCWAMGHWHGLPSRAWTGKPGHLLAALDSLPSHWLHTYIHTEWNAAYKRISDSGSTMERSNFQQLAAVPATECARFQSMWPYCADVVNSRRRYARQF